jgi:signal transduction histidine kinase
MPCAASDPVTRPLRAKPVLAGLRWMTARVWPGLVIVAIVALLDALRDSVKYIVTQPFVQWSPYFASAFAYAAVIGLSILLAVAYAVRRVPRHGMRQYVAVFGAIAAAAGASVLVLTEIPEISVDFALFDFLPALARYSGLGMLIAGAWLYVRAEAQQSAALEQVALDSARMDEQAAEARLQVLEAQIEPHFLFNTLAHVKRLYQVDRGAGARMLRNLKAYLAVALPEMRRTQSTLVRELAHVTAYLDIQQIRMGRRLAYGIDLPPALHDARMPPLMLLTLVENAVKHGLSPSPHGGRIDVGVALDGDRLRVAVADTGVGFTKSKGTGAGLANIRARLSAQYGSAASFSLTTNAPNGLIASLFLPYENATHRGAGQ